MLELSGRDAADLGDDYEANRTAGAVTLTPLGHGVVTATR